MRYSLLAGGKRLRPILCLLVKWLGHGGNGDANGLCLEMIHTMSLIRRSPGDG